MMHFKKDIDIQPKFLTYDELLFANQNLKTENKSLEDQTKLQETEITYLKEQIEILKRAIFGKRSE